MESSYNQGIYSPPKDCNVSIINNIPNNNYMNKLIGKKGIHFIEITKTFNCKYIWHDINKNIIEVWGKNNKDIDKAKLRIQKRLYNILRFDSNIKTPELLKWMDNFRINVICS